MANTDSQRYTAVAIVLHWAIAAAILLNLAAGWWMADAIDDPATKAQAIAAFQVHKSLGLTILVLSLARLAWRLTHTPPPMPAGMARWERGAAHAMHWALYALMVALPFTGWVMVSTQWGDNGPLQVPTVWFGLFKVPHLFGLPHAADSLRADLHEQMEEVHEVLAYAIALMFAGHVGAALRHHFLKGDRLIARLQPGWVGALVLALFAAGFVAGVRHVNGGAGVSAVAAGAPDSAAGGWVLDPSSKIEFSGSNSGTEFRGAWTKWSADIRYDAAHPEASTINATIDTSFGKTGVPMQDEALPQKEWFDVATFPVAKFVSTRVGADGAIEGTLTIKDRALPITGLKASVENGVLKISGHAEVDRKAANLGLESDASGEYVSLKIGVDVNVTAKPPK